jgi:hypothetical protein
MKLSGGASKEGVGEEECGAGGTDVGKLTDV